MQQEREGTKATSVLRRLGSGLKRGEASAADGTTSRQEAQKGGLFSRSAKLLSGLRSTKSSKLSRDAESGRADSIESAPSVPIGEIPTPPPPPAVDASAPVPVTGDLAAWMESQCAISATACAEYVRLFGCDDVQTLKALADGEWPEGISPMHEVRIRKELMASPRQDSPPSAANSAAAAPEPPRPGRGVDKFRPDLPTFVFGKPEVYRAGILARVAPSGLSRSVQEEFETNENGAWLRELRYVTEQPATQSYPDSKGRAPEAKLVPSYTRDLDHDGLSLHDFYERQPKKGDGPGQIPQRLSHIEIAVVRAYTGPWFKSINFYLRYLPEALCCESQPYYEHLDPRRTFLADPERPGYCRHKQCKKAEAAHHRQRLDSWATSAALLCSGIVKLTAASGPGTVYRGVKEEHIQLPDWFVHPAEGEFACGVELAPMSTTFNKEVSLS